MLVVIHEPAGQWFITVSHVNNQGPQEIPVTEVKVLVAEMEVRKHVFFGDHSSGKAAS